MDRQAYSPMNKGCCNDHAISVLASQAIKLCAIALALIRISSGNYALSDAGDAKKPNIVFILTDDHRWDFMSGAGHPFVKTRNLDRLASQGVLFSNAFVTSSLCSPSRASFLTGLYAHTHGVRLP